MKSNKKLFRKGWSVYNFNNDYEKEKEKCSFSEVYKIVRKSLYEIQKFYIIKISNLFIVFPIPCSAYTKDCRLHKNE